MIQVDRLQKLYEDFLAVDDVSFELGKGRICGLVGPNGAGKTTTMRCIAGLIPATTGELTVAGCKVSRDSLELKRKLAYVPDDPPLFDDLSVAQHLDFIGRLYQVGDYQQKSMELLDYFDLAEKRNAGATTLSRGMRQKLAISCAYLFEPQVILLDEPMTGLDPPGIRKLLESIRLRANAGVTFIISSHLLAMIEDVCTDLIVMQNGSLQYFGGAHELRHQFPNTTSLEEAYFAATAEHSSENIDASPVIIAPPLTASGSDRVIGVASNYQHQELFRLSLRRGRFRIGRTIERLRSPRRIVATILSILFLALYLVNGIFVLAVREPADPGRLRLWLSGGMAIYTIYHLVRCAWSQKIADLQLSDAESLWLVGAPVKRSALAVYHLSNAFVSSLMKTGLLVVVLARDVDRLELLIVAIFASLVLLETTRLIIERFTAGLNERSRRQLRVVSVLIASAVAIQVVARVFAWTPAEASTVTYLFNGFRSFGETAACEPIQWLSLPWMPASQLAVTSSYSWQALFLVMATAGVLPLAVLALVNVDAWASAESLRHERQRLRDVQAHRVVAKRESSASFSLSIGPRGASCSRLRAFICERVAWVERLLPTAAGDMISIARRQWVSVSKYKGTILFSFAVPTLLSLSPLTTGQVTEQWFFVVGGIALCTMLLAPPALKIDFRRDLKRMMLLRSLPVKPLSMVVGQLAIPILITIAFQWSTIAVAVVVVEPNLSQVILWTGMLSALAVFTFATDNALFLAFPHHENNEGLAMLIRTKLTFLGKGTIIGGSLMMLVIWLELCKQLFAEPYAISIGVVGAIAAAWIVATIAIGVTACCWRRFDITDDIPPQ